jgi:hypothetical protein
MSEVATVPPAAGPVLAARQRLAAERVAFAGFLLLFPGFAVYHYAVAAGAVPSFLGGLYGIASALVFLVATSMGGWLLGREAWGLVPLARVVLAVLAYFLVWSVAARLALGSEHYAGPALAESAGAVVLWGAAFFVASFLRVDSPGRRRWLNLAAAGVVAILVAAMVQHQSPLGPLLLFGAESDSDQPSSSYQAVGRSVLMTAMLLAALTPVPWKQLAILSVATVLLVCLGSRAHLFTSALLVIMVLGLSLLKARRRGASLVFLAMALAAVYAGWSLFLETRAGEIFDLSSSTSWGMRQEVQALALKVIADHPLLGDFGYHLREIGPGGYAHNLLSAWPQYGLLGIMCYAGLIGYATLLSLLRVLSPPHANSAWRMALMTNLAALVLVATSEPVFSVVPAAGWGFAVGALLHERERRTRVRYAV